MGDWGCIPIYIIIGAIGKIGKIGRIGRIGRIGAIWKIGTNGIDGTNGKLPSSEAILITRNKFLVRRG